MCHQAHDVPLYIFRVGPLLFGISTSLQRHCDRRAKYSVPRGPRSWISRYAPWQIGPTLIKNNNNFNKYSEHFLFLVLDSEIACSTFHS